MHTVSTPVESAPRSKTEHFPEPLPHAVALTLCWGNWHKPVHSETNPEYVTINISHIWPVSQALHTHPSSNMCHILHIY